MRITLAGFHCVPLQCFYCLKALNIFLLDFIVNKELSLGLCDVDVMKIVEILSVETTEDEHTTAKEASTVSPSGLGDIASYLGSGDLILLSI